MSTRVELTPELEEVYNSLMDEVREDYPEWGYEAISEEANNRFMKKGFPDINELY